MMPKTIPVRPLSRSTQQNVRMLCSQSYVSHLRWILLLFRGADDYFMALS